MLLLKCYLKTTQLLTVPFLLLLPCVSVRPSTKSGIISWSIIEREVLECHSHAMGIEGWETEPMARFVRSWRCVSNVFVFSSSFVAVVVEWLLEVNCGQTGRVKHKLQSLASLSRWCSRRLNSERVLLSFSKKQSKKKKTYVCVQLFAQQVLIKV